MAAPAMDLDMYAHPATQESMDILRTRGVEIIEAASGELASGLDGKGRMEEPELIVRRIKSFFSRSGSLRGRRALVTSGPTREAIDPVRPSEPGVRIVDVVSARQMYEATVAEYDKGSDITVLCAAVADFTPASPSTSKIKKDGERMELTLVPTEDIAAAIGSRRRQDGVVAGFALETDNAENNAMSKLRRKNMDMIVLNSLRDPGAGFGTDTNRVTFFFRNGDSQSLPLESKADVAAALVDRLERLLGQC